MLYIERAHRGTSFSHCIMRGRRTRRNCLHLLAHVKQDFAAFLDEWAQLDKIKSKEQIKDLVRGVFFFLFFFLCSCIGTRSGLSLLSSYFWAHGHGYWRTLQYRWLGTHTLYWKKFHKRASSRRIESEINIDGGVATEDTLVTAEF